MVAVVQMLNKSGSPAVGLATRTVVSPHQMNEIILAINGDVETMQKMITDQLVDPTRVWNAAGDRPLHVSHVIELNPSSERLCSSLQRRIAM